MTDDKRDENFGRQVRRHREALELSLDQLAERAELTPNYIGTVESGKRDPSLSTILALAKGLGTEASELFKPLPDPGPDVA